MPLIGWWSIGFEKKTVNSCIILPNKKEKKIIFENTAAIFKTSTPTSPIGGGIRRDKYGSKVKWAVVQEEVAKKEAARSKWKSTALR